MRKTVRWPALTGWAFGTGLLACVLLLTLLGQWLAAGFVGLLTLTGFAVTWLVANTTVRPQLIALLRHALQTPHPDDDDWLHATPQTAQQAAAFRKTKVRVSVALAALIVLIAAIALVYALNNPPNTTILDAVPIILVLVWASLTVLTLLWQVLNSNHALAALRVSVRRMLYEFQHPQHLLFDPPLRLSVLMLIEVMLVMAMGYYAGSSYLRDDPTQHLRGIEAEWLTSFVYQAHSTLRTEGYISLWNPWFEYGEPLLANPFSFILNPFSTLPGLINGGEVGILQSIVLYAMLAGVGGWFLGRVLGLSSLGRVVLGALMIGKGNMHAMIGMGYYQLGVSQAFIPWAVAGFLAVAYYPHKRWPPVLLAMSMTLMFWAGNVWYTMPTVLSMALLAATHAVWLNGRLLDGRVLRGWGFAAMLTVALSAMTLVPIWTYQNRIGAHPPFTPTTEQADLWRLINSYWTGDSAPWYAGGAYVNESHFYYSYVAPVGVLVVLFVLVPPLWPLTYRAAQASHWRVWSVGAVLAVLFTVWATADNWFVLGLYEQFELLREWRFVGRMLAMASFWVAVLVAMRLDGLTRAIFQPRLSRTWPRTLLFIGPQLSALTVLTVLVLPQMVDGVRKWPEFGWATEPRHADMVCAEWLRAQFPDEQLAVFRPKYDATTAFIVNRIRITPIEADFEIVPDPATLGPPDLWKSPPQIPAPYAFAWSPEERLVLESLGYEPWTASPTLGEILPERVTDSTHCVWRHPNTIAYAFRAPLIYLQAATQLAAALTTPVTVTHRDSDDIELRVPNNAILDQVIVIQELAYPGWQAYLNGERVDAESVGGLLGVVIPVDASAATPTTHRVSFHFRPQLTYDMGAVTLGTCLFLIAYLLRFERVFVWFWARFLKKK